MPNPGLIGKADQDQAVLRRGCRADAGCRFDAPHPAHGLNHVRTPGHIQQFDEALDAESARRWVSQESHQPLTVNRPIQRYGSRGKVCCLMVKLHWFGARAMRGGTKRQVSAKPALFG